MNKSMTRIIGRAAAVLAVVVLAGSAGGIATPTAEAQDASCTRVGPYSTNKRYDVYVPVAGWGWTTWNVNPTVTVWDRCDHGGIDLKVNLYDANVRTKPGGLLTVQVAYYTAARGWVPVGPLVNQTPSPTSTWKYFSYTAGVYGIGHLDLCRTCRITHVRFVTTVWTTGTEGSGRVGLATKTLTLNLVTPAWSST